MSNPVLRRNSSKQGLQNLLRVTAQRSMEDAEEIERERRRRARERQQGQGPLLSPTGPSLDNGLNTEEALCESELKPGCQVALEEDEGFSDWTLRLEKRKQRHLEEQEAREDHRPKLNGTSRPSGKSHSVLEPKEREEEWERRDGNETQDASTRFTGDKVTEKKKEVKILYTSKVFMPQDTRHMNTNGDAAERTTYLVAGKMSPNRRSSSLAEQSEVDGEAEDPFLETERRLERFRRSHAEKEGQELEELRQRQVEEQEELEVLNHRREERRQVREEEERRREEEGRRRQAQEEEERLRMREEIERRRTEATERRMKTLSVSSNEGDESGPFSPMSPTFKNEMEERVTAENSCTITERTESLNRSLKKSNSIKKSLPPVAVSKIDNRLEQYTHAIEISSKEAKAAKQAVMDLPSPTEPVASKKNLFEAGEAWGQCSTKGTPSKDAEGLKVGVADLITQWVKGNPDGTCKSPSSKPAEIKPGDVLNKKNMWENLGDTPSSSNGGKGTSSGKRYKFVVTGHGKYEKIPANDDYDEYTNATSTGQCQED